MKWTATGLSRAIGLPAASIALLVGLAGCASSPTSPHTATGVLTGTAQACAGLIYVPKANLRIYRGDAVTARKNVTERLTRGHKAGSH